MTAQIEGKVALVTGRTSGIGQAAALAFAGEGARVVIAARRSPEGEARREKEEEATLLFDFRRTR